MLGAGDWLVTLPISDLKIRNDRPTPRAASGSRLAPNNAANTTTTISQCVGLKPPTRRYLLLLLSTPGAAPLMRVPSPCCIQVFAATPPIGSTDLREDVHRELRHPRPHDQVLGVGHPSADCSLGSVNYYYVIVHTISMV